MTVNVRTSGGLKEIGQVWLRTSGGLKQIGEIWVRTAAGLEQVFGSFSAVASPLFVSGGGYSSGGIRVSTNETSVSLTPPGTTGASISWASPDAGWDAISPASFSTRFRSPTLGPGQEESTVFTGTIIKGASTIFVTVTAECANGFGS